MFRPCTLIILALATVPALGTTPVIYGEDNRQEVYEASPMFQKLAASTATMIIKDKIHRGPEKPGVVQLDQTTLRMWLESQFEEEEKSKLLSLEAQNAVDDKVTFCSGERFTEQPNAGMCSGFLVGPDLIVTAGHCVTVPDFCEKYDWVFEFQIDPVTKTAGIDLPEENVYSCKRVISSALSTGLGLDYGLIQLDRRVKDREALEVRSEGLIPNSASLVVIGSPSGLPLKVAAGAHVRTNTHPFYFSSNLDTFQGNSGSPVLNATTGEVEGILVRGEADFEANMGLMCIEAKRCDDSSCRGEDVSRMTSIPELAVKNALFRLSAKGDLKELEKLMRNRFWIDIYGKDGKTALMVAVENERTEVTDDLLKRGADASLADISGNTALHFLAKILNPKLSSLLKLLLPSGLEARNKAGETPILVSARALNLYGIKTLIEAGAEMNAVDDRGESALFSFARKGDIRSVKELVSLGIDPFLKNQDGQTIQDILNLNN